MKNTRMLTEGAMTLAIYTVLLLAGLFLPVASLVTSLFLMLPFLVFSSKYKLKNSLLVLGGAVLISGMFGGLLAIPTALLFGTTGIAAGYCIKEGKSKFTAYMAASLIFLVNTVISFVGAIKFLGINFIDDIFKEFERTISAYEKLAGALGQAPDPKMLEQMQAGTELLQLLAPSMVAGASFLLVFIMFLVNFPLAKRFGVKVPRWGSFRNVTLPKSILWYYLLTMLLALILKPEQGTGLFTVLVNLDFSLGILLTLQGLSLLFFISHMKKWPTAVPVIITILMFHPLISTIIRMIGIFDLGFDLRKRLGN